METSAEKQKLITDLYALRAGLSEISSKADEVKALESMQTDKENELSSLKEQYESQKDKVATTENELQNLSDLYEKEKNEREISIKDVSGKNFSTGKFILISVIVFHFLLPLVAGCFAMIYEYISAIVGFVFLGAFTVIFILINIILIVKKKKRAKIAAIKSVDDKISELSKNTEAKKKSLETEKNNLENIKGEVTNFSEKFSQMNKENAQTTALLASEAKACDVALTDLYSGTLANVDWENLDLVIFYLSTGRADTVKEALQQVDLQRRNEALISEIRNANANVCNEIHGGLRALSGALGECFGALSRQINAVRRQVTAQSNLTAAYNRQLIDGVQLNNQLRKKANETSQKLLKDAQYIKSKCK